MNDSYPLIAIMKVANGVVYTEQFKTELQFDAFHKIERPAWITLINKETGHTITQVSYPRINLDF